MQCRKWTARRLSFPLVLALTALISVTVILENKRPHYSSFSQGNVSDPESGLILLPDYGDPEDYRHIYANSREWAILLDRACINQTRLGKPCKWPVKVAATEFLENKHLRMQYLIVDKPDRDYLKWYSFLDQKGEEKFKSRIMPRPRTTVHNVRFTDKSMAKLEIADDQENFIRHFRRSRFIKCNGYKYNRTNVERQIPLHRMFVLSEYRKFADKWNTTFQLACGTLLGWYRECDIIRHTTDIDFTAPSSMVRPDFINELHKNFQILHYFGNENDSFEVNWQYEGIRTDVFFKYPRNETHESIGALDFWNVRQIFSIYPTVKEICAGDLHGVLVYVPCNVEAVLKSEYGNWKEDIIHGSYDYTSNPSNLEYGPKLDATAFASINRVSWP